MSLSLLLEKYDVSSDEGLQKALNEIEKEEVSWVVLVTVAQISFYKRNISTGRGRRGAVRGAIQGMFPGGTSSDGESSLHEAKWSKDRCSNRRWYGGQDSWSCERR